MTVAIAEKGFLEDLCSHPDDDTPRLVYADWLEERGDPRGELIRIQCELAELPSFSPKWHKLKWREKALLQQHSHQWRAELPRLNGITWGEFERGFVSSVTAIDLLTLNKYRQTIRKAAPIRSATISQVNGPQDFNRAPAWSTLRELRMNCGYGLLEHLTRFFDCRLLSTLRALVLTSLEMENQGMHSLLASPHLTRLEALVLDDNFIGNEGLQALAGSQALPSLRKLSMAGRGYGYATDPTVGTAGIAALAESPFLEQLESLNLSGNAITNEGLRLLFRAKAKVLRELSLRENEISPSAIEGMLDSELTANLEALDLSENEIRNEGLTAIASAATNLKNLRKLAICGCGITAPGLRSLTQSPLIRQLHHLDVSRSSLSPAAAKILAQAPCENLFTLKLNWTTIGDSGLSHLAQSPNLPNLRILELQKSGITNEGLKGLATSPHLLLLSLNLSENKVRSEGLSALGHSAMAQHLHELNLDSCSLDKNCFQALAHGGFRSLQSLQLKSHGVSVVSLRPLFESASLNSLSELSLRGNPLGAEGIEVLARSPLAEQLTMLDLSLCQLDDDAIAVLASAQSFNRLETLKLEWNRISDNGFQSMAQAPHFPALSHISAYGNPFHQAETSAQLNNRFNMTLTYLPY